MDLLKVSLDIIQQLDFEGRNNGTQFKSIDSAISVSSISPTSFTPSANTSGNQTIVITGNGFKASPTVKVIGNNGTVVNASSVTSKYSISNYSCYSNIERNIRTI